MGSQTKSSQLSGDLERSLKAKNVHPFGAIEQVCGPELLLGLPIDRIARAIHEAYLAKHPPAPGVAPTPSQLPWDRLPEEFKQANRAQADHIDVKLRAISCERIPFEAGALNIHAVSAAAIEEVTLKPGQTKPISVEVIMNNSAGIFQLDELLKRKLENSSIAPYVQVLATIQGPTEQHLFEVYSL